MAEVILIGPMKGLLRRYPNPPYLIDKNGCWMWQGGLNRDGYPSKQEHRKAYTRKYGEISAGMHLDHTCRNRACCNPSHLEPVTPLENQHRKLRANGYAGY